MDIRKIENELETLRNNWPAPSVAAAVIERIQILPARPEPRVRIGRLTVTVLSLTALLTIAVVGGWSLIASPRSLSAQIADGIRKSKSAHITIRSTDPTKPVREAQIWFARGFGIRAESKNEAMVDNGRFVWKWNPSEDEAMRLVFRRPSADGIVMVTEMFSLENTPVDWQKSRSRGHDREFGGVRCEAYLIVPPVNTAMRTDEDEAAVSFRHIVWLDPSRRICRIETQSLKNQSWTSRNEMTLTYDGDVDQDRFVADFPTTVTIVDEGSLWADRFPLAKAIGTVERGGLLFAVHEVVRCENDMFYVVSSVRGTQEHLKKFPPKRRRLNWSLTLLDVAHQLASCTVQGDYKRIALSSANEEGVDYLWWIAVPRRPFGFRDGKRIDLGTESKLEPTLGQLRIPLEASYLDDAHQGKGESVTVNFNISTQDRSESTKEIASRARRDAMLSGMRLFGPIKNNVLGTVDPKEITDDAFADAVRSNIELFDALDEVKGNLPPASVKKPVPYTLPETITGRVVDPDNEPVADAKVMVGIQFAKKESAGATPSRWTTQTDATGAYKITTNMHLLQVEDYLLIEVIKEGFPKLDGGDGYRQAETGELPVQHLVAPRTIRGRLVDPVGNVIKSAQLRIHSVTMQPNFSIWMSDRISVDEDGHFSAVIPKAGKALMEVLPAEYAKTIQRIPDGDVDFGDIKAKQGTVVKGIVVDAKGNPLAKKAVGIITEHHEILEDVLQVPLRFATLTNEKGEFSLTPNLGRYRVWVTESATTYNNELFLSGDEPPIAPPQVVDLKDEATIQLRFRTDK